MYCEISSIMDHVIIVWGELGENHIISVDVCTSIIEDHDISVEWEHSY